MAMKGSNHSEFEDKPHVPEEVRPPRWARRFLEWYCRPRLLEDLEGDLNEYFERNLKTKGAKRARWNYILDVLKFFRPYTVRKPEFLHIYIHWIMIGSYFRTSRRSLVRNKLFSFINVIGLAVSMSVGLLVIAFLMDLLSYDEFHAKKNRIYRVTSRNEVTGQSPMDFASTSSGADEKIRGSIAGIEDITLVRPGFSGDAKVNAETILPFSGWWADASFFKIFSFPLLQGDAATALKEPYSLVLTKKTARKLFGEANALGKSIQFDTLTYTVTGVAADIPKLSHIRFDALVSFSSVEKSSWAISERNSWDHIYSNYIYLTLPQNTDPQSFNANLTRLSARENVKLKNQKISLSLQPMETIALGKHYANEIGANLPVQVIWVLGGLAFVVILSACFNYTNLSIARSLRRSREVGIRKIVGALKSHVLAQFVAESVIIALLALVFSFIIFLLLRTQFIALDPFMENLISLEMSPKLILCFIAMAMVTGLVAGIFPALFFSRMKAIQVLKDASSLKMFKHISMRKALIVIQYTFSLMFITTTTIGYFQYKDFLSYDLGYTTENILNIQMLGNKSELLKKELSEIPAVGEMSRSNIVTSLGSLSGTSMKYKDSRDSARVWLNFVDTHYLPIHRHQFLAGSNFKTKAVKGNETEVIVNEQLLKRFNIGGQNPANALGEVIQMDDRKLMIVGVLKDFHYGTMEDKIEPMAFRYYDDESTGGYLNVTIKTTDWPATRATLEQAWRKIDKVHPFEAKFYDDQIEQAYRQFSVMLKVVGFITFLAICIASMGLFGMVVFTTETRLKEISIRKVLGASERGLVFLLSKGFLSLLVIATLVALPATYFLFDKVILSNFVYHKSIGIAELFGGVVAVMVFAFLLIGSQTLKAARSNPANVLKSE